VPQSSPSEKQVLFSFTRNSFVSMKSLGLLRKESTNYHRKSAARKADLWVYIVGL